MSIGVLLFAATGSRLRGDPGCPGTFDFPVEYGVVEGSYRDLIEGSEVACRRLCIAAERLERKGVRAIAGDCGLMALYQRELTEAVSVPVVSSSLALLPFIRGLIGRGQAIGILTGHSEILQKKHLHAAGAAGLYNLVIQGMQEEPHFREAVLEGKTPQNYERMKEDVIHGVIKMMDKNHKLGAVLLECSNLAVFGGEITREFGLPVFDINSAIYFLNRAYENLTGENKTKE